MKISDQESYKKKMEFLCNAEWAAPGAFAGAADDISKEIAKPIRRWTLIAFALWIIGGLLSLAFSIGTLALAVWAVVWVLQSMGVL